MSEYSFVSIFENLVQGSLLVLRIDVIIYIIMGTLIGVIFGSIPGLTTNMCVALFLPFTYYLDPLFGIPFLVGVFKGGIYGGSIPAILLNTPGHNAAVATVFDGYPLAQQGRAKSAMSVALYSSVLGDLGSDIFTIFTGAFAASLAMLLGSPEILSILVFSVCIIAILSGASLVKGLIGASIGLLLGCVGTDLTGRDRFIFGEFYFSDGLPILPLFVGLFTISTTIGYVVDWYKKDSDIKTRHLKIAEISRTDHLTLREFIMIVPHIIRSTLVGIFIGLVPAVGKITSAMLGYGIAKKYAKQKDKFGKGALEGVAGPEAANNAVNGPAMIPMLIFGIPGDLTTALLMSVFILHGIRPGPRIFLEQGELIYAIFGALILGNISLIFIGYLYNNIYSYIGNISLKFIIPIVLATAICGVFAVNNSMIDLVIMITAGFIGLLIKRAGIPTLPLLITFLLGTRIEKTLSRTLIIFNGDFIGGILNRTFALVTFALAILIIIMPIITFFYRKMKYKYMTHTGLSDTQD